MRCTNCGSDNKEWLDKFVKRPKVYLDKIYFDENHVLYREDERGMYIPGRLFYEIELEKAHEKCLRCCKMRV